MKKPKAIRWDPAKDAAESAREVLPELAAGLFRAGRQAVSGATNLEALHQLRLLAKRFRYTVEVFQPLYGPGIQGRLKKLRALQQCLGDINDCATTRNLVASLDGKKKLPRTQPVMKWLDRREQELVDAFLAHWKAEFDAPGEEQRWLRYLRHYAGRGGGVRR